MDEETPNAAARAGASDAETHGPAEAVETEVVPPDAVEPAVVVSRKTADERKQLLAQTIQTQVAGGSRVESQSDYQAVLVRGHRPNHTLHFIIGIFTLGLWWLVWAGIAIFGGEKRQMAQVDEFGNVTLQQL